MANNDKNVKAGSWKTSWLDEGDGSKIFTKTFLKALVLLVWIGAYSLMRSVLVFAFLCAVVVLVYRFFLPEELAELQKRVVAEQPSTLYLIFAALLWHGLVVEVFGLLRKWKKRKRNTL